MRGFVLSRSFYAGTQRYGAIWQGDNLGTWEHLAVSIPMLLSNGLAGMAFQGADVGGFFGNPTTDMLVRWYQAGSFMPFFRAHAHIDTKRREPYLFEAHILKSIRDSLRLRYSLLPTWYTAFFENSITGAPIVKPQSVVFPDDEQGYAVDDQFYVGSSGLLVKPITHRDTYETEIYLDDAEVSLSAHRSRAAELNLVRSLTTTTLLTTCSSAHPLDRPVSSFLPRWKHFRCFCGVVISSQGGISSVAPLR